MRTEYVRRWLGLGTPHAASRSTGPYSGAVIRQRKGRRNKQVDYVLAQLAAIHDLSGDPALPIQ
ncbi:MAG: hypothetical protein HY040_24950 [Planctomycetes bacterium]|nr:hypothetical protein [Planctomycetota bacterium]